MIGQPGSIRGGLKNVTATVKIKIGTMRMALYLGIIDGAAVRMNCQMLPDSC
jgi:hypothetical protein